MLPGELAGTLRPAICMLLVQGLGQGCGRNCRAWGSGKQSSMAITVGLHHVTRYDYDKPIGLGPQVVRLRVTPRGVERHVGYALVSDTPPGGAPFSVAATGSVVTLKTAAVTAEVELRPDLRVTFRDADGGVLNEDLPGKELGITLEGRKVTVYKRLQDGERFIGMGEQLGNLDRRGSVITLRNTDNYRYDDPKVKSAILGRLDFREPLPGARVTQRRRRERLGHESRLFVTGV